MYQVVHQEWIEQIVDSDARDASRTYMRALSRPIMGRKIILEHDVAADITDPKQQ